MSQSANLIFNWPKGGSTMENNFNVLDVSHQIEAARDPQSGLPTGRLQHNALHVTKEMDSTSPILLSLLTKNETLSLWRLDFQDDSPAGKGKVDYRIELTKAVLVSYQLVKPGDGKARLPPHEDLGFVYEKITWTAVQAKTTASDDWAR